ncbi:hypothetical protein LSUE1_G003453 [Lachnellula suecica]|uniref:DUF7580 domain-containing protein n=1 Tax=Lachnellula suecica TaxID=602035 RepID=A0A8T9CHY9_9HELO|nr:hypothetical protein LSUE1_G003453 [Lachnellula suecica]
MDPATIAGLALGIAPLIISAVESYEVTFQPFVTYRRYSREVARFTTKLEAQKAIFNNQCQLLLLAAQKNGRSEEVMLDHILKDSNHPSRRNGELNDRLNHLLGESHRSCVSTLRMIHETLDEITKETRGFKELSCKKPGERTTFSHFRSKIKISFSKTRLNETVNELRLHNDDLRVLATQVSAVTREKGPITTSTSSFVFELQTTQQASEALHVFLKTKWLCDSQVDHAANLSLDLEAPQRHFYSGVGFHLSLTCSSQTPRSQDTIWLNIKSTSKEINHAEEGPEANVSSNVTILTKTFERLGIITDLPKDQNILTPKASAPSTMPGGTMILNIVPTIASSDPDIEELCSFFHSQPRALPTTNNSAYYCVTTSNYEHRVHKCPSPPGFVNRTLSLKTILENDVTLRRRETWVSKFKLARLLTLGVLRFQSTPWLRGTLDSGNIHFLENEPHTYNNNYSLEGPFLHTQLSRSTTTQHLTGIKASHLARNELLFNLGVILLELGYDAPLQQLRRAEDIKDGDTDANWYIDFFTARRLAQSAPRELDARYGRLAKKCLDCDFGVGDDLKSLELQCFVVMDIVNELDKCIELDEQINSKLPSQ